MILGVISRPMLKGYDDLQGEGGLGIQYYKPTISTREERGGCLTGWKPEIVFIGRGLTTP